MERFEIAFNQIHLILKGLAKDTRSDNFIDLLNNSKDKHATIRHHFEQLKQFARLRNAIVHEKVRQDYYIADPHWEIVYEIEQIRDILQKPPSAMAIASKPVLYFESDAPMNDILKAVAKFGYSQFPIYNNGLFKGLLTNGGIVRWFSRAVTDQCIMIDNMKPSDILPIEKTHNAGFLSEEKTIFDVEALFESHFNQKKKIEAVIITSSGNKNEPPLGIITPWDLIQIDHNLIPLFSG